MYWITYISYTTSIPNGDRASFASRKCIFPQGKPMMVIIRTSPAMKYSMAVCSPPKINQMIFPNIFIVFAIQTDKAFVGQAFVHF